MTNQDRIYIEFANTTFNNFNDRRFGIGSCNASLDYEYINDLREILDRSLELESCDDNLDDCCGCNLDTINERIQTI